MHYFVTFKLKIFQLVQVLCLSCVRLLLDGKGDGFCVSNTFFLIFFLKPLDVTEISFLDVAMALSALNIILQAKVQFNVIEHEIGAFLKDSSFFDVPIRLNDTKLSPNDHFGPVWYWSEPSDITCCPNQFLDMDFFCHFLQQSGSSWQLFQLEYLFLFEKFHTSWPKVNIHR